MPTKNLITICILVLIIALPKAAETQFNFVVCYVNWSASGDNNGTSWKHAYKGVSGVQSALADGTCTQIWVAKGLYVPGGDRTDTFQLKNGVALYGGFDGTETRLSGRDIVANETVLFGNIMNLDIDTDNVYHVVTGSGTDRTAVLDGFIVEKGYADGRSPDNKGGGMYTDSGSPIVRNVRFRNNRAYSGGGMYNNHSTSEISGALFDDNVATYGAGMYNGMSDVTVVNSTFWSGNADHSGGAIHNSYSNPSLTNLTLVNNQAGYNGGAMSNENSAPVVDNTIMWKNTTSSFEKDPQIYDDESSATVVRNSVVEDGFEGGINIITSDPLLGGLSNNGGRMKTVGIAYNSPAIDKSTTNCASVDQRGLSRSGLGKGCDIGAYEFVPTLYVSMDGRTDGFCQSWSFACDLQYALSSSTVGQDVWVETGTYKPTKDTDRKISFELRASVDLYGGFTGTEDNFDDRDPKTNITILSGDIGVPGDETDNSFHVVRAESIHQATYLDGFTISYGYADDAEEQSGGGLMSIDSYLILDRVDFYNNYATEDGGGMYLFGEGITSGYGGPMFRDVIFTENSARYGGGLYIFEGSASLSRVTFINNQARSSGGGMSIARNQAPYTKKATAISNATFSNNTVGSALGSHGGAISVSNSTDISIMHSTFNGNSSSDSGGAASIGVSSTVNIANSIFWGNSASFSDPQIRYRGELEIIHDSVVQGGFASGTNIITEDPKLGTLGDYGGYTPGIPLLNGSSAINIVTPGSDWSGFPYGCGVSGNPVLNDQRGIFRPQGLACDLGAFEVEQAPAVFSVIRYGPSPTSEQLVEFIVIFTEVVEGEDETDFALWTTGSITGASIVEVNGGSRLGRNYVLVKVNMGSGAGSVGLDVKSSGTGIKDLDGNDLNGGFTGGEFYTTIETDGSIFANGFESN